MEAENREETQLEAIETVRRVREIRSKKDQRTQETKSEMDFLTQLITEIDARLHFVLSNKEE